VLDELTEREGGRHLGAGEGERDGDGVAGVGDGHDRAEMDGRASDFEQAALGASEGGHRAGFGYEAQGQPGPVEMQVGSEWVGQR
jgi:hypothetical protein